MLASFCVAVLIFWRAFAESVGTNDLTQQSDLPIYWNIPTFQCDYHKLNFTDLAAKYNIKQNSDDRFRGDTINILYDPGDFPAILHEPNRILHRNGGVPQAGNLSLHLALFENLLVKLIPDVEFSGLAIIDFESWRPIYRQNFGTLLPYKTLSIDLENQEHPFWPDLLIEKEARRHFEFAARKFMEETLFVAKQLRPNATWGYYGYPLCFNMSPSNMHTECPDEVTKENDRLDWLFGLTDNLHPSLYFSENHLSTMGKMQMIEGRVGEAYRVANYVKTTTHRPNIIPYIWYKYQDTRNFLREKDLANTLTFLLTVKVDGAVIWGSSADVNTKKKCYELYEYIDNVLGPILVSLNPPKSN